MIPNLAAPKLLLIRASHPAAGSAIRFELPAGAELHEALGAADAVRALMARVWDLILFDLDSDPQSVADTAASLDGLTGEAVEGGRPRIGLCSRGWPTPSQGLDKIIDPAAGPLDWPLLLGQRPADASPDPSFDADDLIDRMMGNEVLAKRLVGVFLEDAPRQLLALSEALSREDSTSSSRIAHSIRGAASNAGGEALVELAKTIEHDCKSGNLQQARKMVPQLEDRFARLRPKLEEFVG